MIQERIWQLIQKRKTGEAASTELQELDALLHQHPEWSDFAREQGTPPAPERGAALARRLLLTHGRSWLVLLAFHCLWDLLFRGGLRPWSGVLLATSVSALLWTLYFTRQSLLALFRSNKRQASPPTLQSPQS